MLDSTEQKVSVETTVTPKQKKKIQKLADHEVLSTSAFLRKHLVKSLKLKEE